MATSIGEIEATIRLRDQLTPQLQVLSRELGKTSKTLSSIGSDIQSFGSNLLPVSAALIGIGAASAKFFSDFESSTTKLVTLSGVSADTMREMREAMLDLGPAVGIGPRALADAMLVVTSTGIRGAEAMEILERAAKASAIGLGETKDVARAVTSAITAYGKENLSAAEATDILFATVKAGGAEANELAGTLGRVVGIASQVGVSFKEVGGFLATFTRLGVDSAEAVTALRGVLATVLKPSKDAREQLLALGTSIEELRANIQEQGLTEALIGLVEAANGNEDAIAAIVPNVRALAGVMGTAGAQSDEFRKVLEEIENGAGGVDRAFKILEETTGFTMAQIVAGLETAAIKLGKALNVRDVVEAAKPLFALVLSLADAFGDLPRPVKTAILAIAGLLAAGGPFAFAIGGAIRIVGDLTKALSWFLATSGGQAVAAFFRTMATSVLPAYAASAETAAAASLGLKTALGLIGLAAVSIGTGFLLAKRDMDAYITNQREAQAATEQTKAAFDQLQDAFKNGVNGRDTSAIADLLSPGAVRPNIAGAGGFTLDLAPKPSTPTGGRNAVQQLTDDVKALVDELSGRAVQQQVRDIARAIASLNGTSQISAVALQELGQELLELERRGAVLPESLRSIAIEQKSLDNVTTDVAASFQALTLNSRSLTPSLKLAEDRVKAIRAAFESMQLTDPVAFLQGLNLEVVKLGEAPPRLRDQWITALDAVSGGFQQLAQVGGQTFSAISRGIGTSIAATGQLLQSINQIAQGGVQNVVAGLASMAGAIAQLTQMAIDFGKALADAFTRSGAEKAASDLRRQFDLDIDENDPLVQSIDDLVSTRFRDGLARGEAIVLHLNEILERAGGVTDSNFGQFLSRSVELFALIERGGEIGEQALTSLNDVLGALGDHLVEQGGLWDEYFIDVLARARAEGLELANVMRLLEGEMTKVAGGLDVLTGAFLDKLNAQGAVSGSSSMLEALFGSPDDAFAMQAEFDRLSRTVFASFNAFIAAGGSAVDAIELLGPAIDDLATGVDDFGLSGSAAFESLRRWRDLVAQNEQLLASVGALNDVMTGLANIGGLTAETFADLQKQGVQAFNDLTAAGFSEQEALAQLAPFLETLIELHKRRGLVIDDETQALIDQATEQGIIQADAMSTNDVLMTGLQGLANLFGEIFGVQVPDLFNRMVDKAKEAADGVQEAFDKLRLPDLTAPSLTFPGGPTGPGLPKAAAGGIVTRATALIAGEAGPEAIIPLNDDVLGRMGGGGSVYIDARGAFFRSDEDLRILADEILPHVAGAAKRHGLTRVG